VTGELPDAELPVGAEASPRYIKDVRPDGLFHASVSSALCESDCLVHDIYYASLFACRFATSYSVALAEEACKVFPSRRANLEGTSKVVDEHVLPW
jgi:hypothetical protein